GLRALSGEHGHLLPVPVGPALTHPAGVPAISYAAPRMRWRCRDDNSASGQAFGIARQYEKSACSGKRNGMVDQVHWTLLLPITGLAVTRVLRRDPRARAVRTKPLSRHRNR